MSHPEFSIIKNSGFFTVDFTKEGMGGQTRYCLTGGSLSCLAFFVSFFGQLQKMKEPFS